MLFSNPIPNLISGVSQQADSMKFPSQAVDQVNAVSHVVEGLIKRPPTNHVKRVVVGDVQECKVHDIYRDASQKFFAIFKDNSVAVFDAVTGAQKTVNFTGPAEAYLTTATPSTSIKALSIADYTFVLNKEVAVETTADESAALSQDSLVVVKQGDYGKVYSISIDGVVEATHTADASDPIKIGTDFIAAALVTAWNLSAPSGYTIARSGSVIHITKTTGTYKLEVSDGLNGAGLGMVKGEVRSFTDLPVVAPDGFVVKVAGDVESSADDYWVTFATTDGDAFTSGKWVETLAPGLVYELDRTTMPHVLVHEADDTFTFRQGEWEDRLVGDDDTAPLPSFINKTLTNMTFFRNRLGFLADENIILSESGQFFNFFRTTVTTLLDAEPIDIAASHNQVSLLYHAVPFFDQLILMGQKSQFTLRGGQESLTLKNVSIQPATELDMNIEATPVLSGRNLYFGFGRGQFTGLWEYYVSSDTDRLAGDDVTIGVPSYVQGNLLELVASESEKILVARTDDSANHLYVYKFYSNGGERVQSSWSRWEFDPLAQIKGMAVFGNELYLLVNRTGDGLCIERIDLQSGLYDAHSTYTVLLDRKCGDTMTGTYNSSTDKTTFYLPYGLPSGIQGYLWAVSRFTESYEGGARLGPDEIRADGTVTFDGDVSSIPMWFGLNYSMEYTMSKPHPRASQDSNRIQVGRRYQVRRGVVSYHNALYFKVKVIPEYRAESTYVFTGKQFGTPTTEVGSQELVSGSFTFAVMTQNTQLTVKLINDLPFPAALTTVDWIGDFVPYR